MLYRVPGFLLTAIAAGALGFGGMAGTATGSAQFSFLPFLALLPISVVVGLFRRA